MTKKFSFHFLLCLAALLSRQVSATFHPLTTVTSTTSSRVSASIGSKQAKDFDTMTVMKSHSIASIHAVRGGGLNEMVSDFNDYVGASKSRSWAVLVFSILTDTVSVTLMKSAQREATVWKIALSFFGFALSLAGFGFALKAIDVSIAYAVWASVGTAIVSIVGIVFFGERLDMAKVLCLAMILLGVVGLEMADRH